MKVGLILGGGGEVGIAWEIGVLSALEMEAGFVASASTVIAGTSAGAIVGACAAQGRAMPELARLESLGQGVTAGGPAATGQQPSNPTIPDDIIQALVSTEGTLEERGARLGKLALRAPTSLDQSTFVDAFRQGLGTDDWPDADFRPTTVSAETGKTTLWDRHSGIGLAAAVASSCAVPGVFPPVEFEGQHFFDVPRRPFSAELIKAKSLDAIVFVGLNLPILANNNEQRDELAAQAAGGRLGTVTITGGPGVEAIAGDLLDPSARVPAVQVGLDDGRDAAGAVMAIMRT